MEKDDKKSLIPKRLRKLSARQLTKIKDINRFVIHKRGRFHDRMPDSCFEFGGTIYRYKDIDDFSLVVLSRMYQQPISTMKAIRKWAYEQKKIRLLSDNVIVAPVLKHDSAGEIDWDTLINKYDFADYTLAELELILGIIGSDIRRHIPPAMLKKMPRRIHADKEYLSKITCPLELINWGAIPWQLNDRQIAIRRNVTYRVVAKQRRIQREREAADYNKTGLDRLRNHPEHVRYRDSKPGPRTKRFLMRAAVAQTD